MDCSKPRKNWTGEVQLLDARMGNGGHAASAAVASPEPYVVEEFPAETMFSGEPSGLHKNRSGSARFGCVIWPYAYSA